MDVFRRRTVLHSEPQNCQKKWILIIHFTGCDIEAFAALLCIFILLYLTLLRRLLLSWTSLFVAKQYLAKTLLTSGECVFVARQQQAFLKILKSGWGRTAGGLLWQFWAESGRLQCECVSLYSVSVCIQTSISSSYHFFLFWILPLLCTLIMTTMMSLKKVSLSSRSLSLYISQRYQSTSHCIEMTTIQKEKGQKKKGKRAYKRVTFVMVFCGINTYIMYDPSCNKESQ